MATTLLVRKDDLSQARLLTREAAPLSMGQVRVALGPLALTANNITYAAFGDSMDYWRFFPAGEDGWGVIPTWGFGTVVQSLHPGMAVGERLYGYWPIATEALVQPERLTSTGFHEGSAHRQPLHAVYNRYLRANADAMGEGVDEAVQALLRPLFATSWLIDDFLADNAGFGARRLLLSSASSKTAYGTAYLLAQRGGFEVVGLTSGRNRAFCEGLGCYSRVVPYEEVRQLPAGEPCVYVDFAGDADLRRGVHEHFADLRYSCAVGGTHVERLGGATGLPGPRPTLFFAPEQAKKRQREWGGELLQERMLAGWRAFLARVTHAQSLWLQVQRHAGAPAALQAYGQVLAGQADPRTGYVLDLR
ncbi:MAG TPA: DUF2855 family protein [Ramlibacter sp.]|nr:DUF2855 family protein [Ramlibacter sp.]